MGITAGILAIVLARHLKNPEDLVRLKAQPAYRVRWLRLRFTGPSGSCARLMSLLRHTSHAIQWPPLLPGAGMTPEQDTRIRELIKLIVDERDPGRLWILAADLERLLTASGGPLPSVHQKARSS